MPYLLWLLDPVMPLICLKGLVECSELPDPCLTEASLWSQLDLALKARLVVMVELHMEVYQPSGQTLVWVRASHMFVIQMKHANPGFPDVLPEDLTRT